MTDETEDCYLNNSNAVHTKVRNSLQPRSNKPNFLENGSKERPVILILKSKTYPKLLVYHWILPIIAKYQDYQL